MFIKALRMQQNMKVLQPCFISWCTLCAAFCLTKCWYHEYHSYGLWRVCACSADLTNQDVRCRIMVIIWPVERISLGWGIGQLSIEPPRKTSAKFTKKKWTRTRLLKLSNNRGGGSVALVTTISSEGQIFLRGLSSWNRPRSNVCRFPRWRYRYRGG